MAVFTLDSKVPAFLLHLPCAVTLTRLHLELEGSWRRSSHWPQGQCSQVRQIMGKGNQRREGIGDEILMFGFPERTGRNFRGKGKK